MEIEYYEDYQEIDFEESTQNGVCNDQTSPECVVIIDEGVYNPTKQIRVWNDEDTSRMLEKYYEYMKCIGPLKQFKNKKQMWEAISLSLKHWSWKQCEQRYKTVLKRKKQSVDNNKSSGATRSTVQYEEQLHKIADLDDSIEPEVQISSQQYLKKRVNDETGTSSSFSEKISKRKPKKSVQETILEVAKMKEEGKEKRHREKMEQSEKLQQLMIKLLEQS